MEAAPVPWLGLIASLKTTARLFNLDEVRARGAAAVMEYITRRRAAKVRPYRTCSPSRRQHQLLYVYVILKAAPLRTFQVSTRLSSTGSQFLPGPNSTGRRSVTFIHHFHPKFNFHRVSSAGTNSRAPFPARRALKASFSLSASSTSACRVLTSAGRNILPCSRHAKRE